MNAAQRLKETTFNLMSTDNKVIVKKQNAR